MNKALINCFNDTLNISNNILSTETTKAINSNKIYKENFISHSRFPKYNAYIRILNDTSFNVAKEYSHYNKTAVLNFANPHFPGGGVKNGARAQEESLCRRSNLYPCLDDENVFGEYYLYNRNKNDFLFSDRIIYTKDVTVFKDDFSIPQMLPQKEWFQVDVMTCAAPYLEKNKHTSQKALKAIFKARIKNIFEVAIDNDVEVIVLGAFGCGAFKNPPKVVAKAFHEVINENHYQNYFKYILFAIKVFDDWNNFRVFSEEFNFIELTRNCPEYVLPEINLPNQNIIKSVSINGCHEPIYFTIDDVKRNIANGKIYFPAEEKYYEDYERQYNFITWQYHNRYFNKRFSILGDYISTPVDYNCQSYNSFYNQKISESSAVNFTKPTWWEKVIDFFGGELLTNNSWSDSCVTCNHKHILSSDGRKPDVLIIYLGTNDWSIDAKLNDLQYTYDAMLEIITSNYPNTEVWCCTLNTSFMSTNPAFEFTYEHNGIHIEQYNHIIKEVSNKHNCKVIDLYKYHIPYDTIDGFHPNIDGMDTLATLVIREICGIEIYSFMHFENQNFLSAENTPKENLIIDNKYKLLSISGESLTSKVYLANNLKTNKRWAIKILSDDYKFNEQVKKSLIKEAHMLMKLNHPAIPHVVDTIVFNDNIGIVMDYIEGKSLNYLVENFGRQPVELVVDLSIQLCDFLEYLHSQNPPYIYNNMNPKNIILKPDMKISVVGFGIMRLYTTSSQTIGNVCLGNPDFASPEQYGTTHTDQRSDIYSLGMTMYNLCFGIIPKGKSYIIENDVSDPAERGLTDIIRKCTELNPKNRYPSCKELRKDLNYLKERILL